MVDLFLAMEELCFSDIAAKVRNAEFAIESNNHYINDVMNSTVNYDKRCQDAIIGYWFSCLNGSENLAYIYGIAEQAVARSYALSEDTFSMIRQKANIVPYVDQVFYAKTYFLLLIIYGVKPTEDVKRLSISERDYFQDSPLWYKQLYLASFGNKRAFDYLLKAMMLETNPSVLVMMFSDAVYLGEVMRNKVIETFSNDMRRTQTSFENIHGSMIKEHVTTILSSGFR